MRVRLGGPNLGARTFVVRLDRAGQLAEVQRIEDLPASALGILGLTEIFPAAAGAPPDRAAVAGRALGGRRARLACPASARTRLRGSGRLTELGVVDGEEVATDRQHVPPGREGDDRARRRAASPSTGTPVDDRDRHPPAWPTAPSRRCGAVTRGRFRLTLLPPAGTTGPAVPGTLTVEVRSHTIRVG